MITTLYIILTIIGLAAFFVAVGTAYRLYTAHIRWNGSSGNSWVVIHKGGWYFTGNVDGWAPNLYEAETYSSIAQAIRIARITNSIVISFIEAADADRTAYWVIKDKHGRYFSDADTTKILGSDGAWSTSVEVAHQFITYEDASLIRPRMSTVEKVYNNALVRTLLI